MPLTVSTTTLYTTSDGTEFLDEREARDHEIKLNLLKIVEGFHFHDMSIGEIAEAIFNNATDILAALNEEGY